MNLSDCIKIIFAFPDEGRQFLTIKVSYIALVELLPASFKFSILLPMCIHTLVKHKDIGFITFTCFNWLTLIEIIKGSILFITSFLAADIGGKEMVLTPHAVDALGVRKCGGHASERKVYIKLLFLESLQFYIEL